MVVKRRWRRVGMEDIMAVGLGDFVPAVVVGSGDVVAKR